MEAGICLSCEQEVSCHDLSGVILSLQAVAGDRITTLALITQVRSTQTGSHAQASTAAAAPTRVRIATVC
jgi:hypothetical protein